MKKYITILVILTTVLFFGCDKSKVPSIEEMTKIANNAGITTGIVANMINPDETTRTTVIEIISKVEVSIPKVGETFSYAWNPIATEYVSQLISESKITEDQGDLILKAFDLATKGLDYILFIKYPKAAKKLDLVEAAAHGFIDGFLSEFKPINKTTATPIPDQELYDYLTK